MSNKLTINDLKFIEPQQLFKEISEYEDQDRLGVAKNMIAQLLTLQRKQEDWGQVWTDIEDNFYNFKDLRKMLTYCRAITLKYYICDDHSCLIFPNLTRLSQDLCLEVYSSLESAKEELSVDSRDYEAYRVKFIKFKQSIVKIFSEIHQLFTTKMTQRFEEERYLQYVLRLLGKFIQAKKEGMEMSLGTGNVFEQLFVNYSNKAGFPGGQTPQSPIDQERFQQEKTINQRKLETTRNNKPPYDLDSIPKQKKRGN